MAGRLTATCLCAKLAQSNASRDMSMDIAGDTPIDTEAHSGPLVGLIFSAQHDSIIFLFLFIVSPFLVFECHT